MFQWKASMGLDFKVKQRNCNTLWYILCICKRGLYEGQSIYKVSFAVVF